MTATPTLTSTLRELVHPLASSEGTNVADIDAIVERIGAAPIILLGEASHGTHDFYVTRAAITRRLIESHGVRAVTIEGDWPDARRIDRFVRHLATNDTTVDEALGGFQRFPQWMWRNTVVRDFVGWLRDWNTDRPATERCGFFGLDLYSLHASIGAVITYLDEVDVAAAGRARERYSCFEEIGGDDPQAYGFAASRAIAESCEEGVVRQLADLRHCAHHYSAADGGAGLDDFFSAEQNARLVANAERYYRSMFRGRSSSWNLRDTHMVETLEAVVAHLERDGEARVCVWAHNSHLGDARATAMGRGGELNVGQLVRQRFDGRSLLVGFTTYDGTVTAAHDWDEPGERRNVRPGLPGSIERLFHQVGVPNFLLDLREQRARTALDDRYLERAIGVIYRPETERQSHYFDVELARQFDLVVHFDRTRALEPLEAGEGWHDGEPPEAYPPGL